MINILIVSNAFQNGGIANLFYNITKNCEREKYHFDYLNTLSLNQNLENEVFQKYKKMGSKRYIISSNNRNKVICTLQEIIKIHRFFCEKSMKYDCVHVNQCKYSMFVLLMAKIKKIPVRIIHAHTVPDPDEKTCWKSKIYNTIEIRANKILATHRIGCSKQACEFLFGIKNRNFQVLYNGIDMKKFYRQNYEYKKLVKKYDINKNVYNFIFVGRFSEQKNPLYLLKVFKFILDKYPDACLRLVGQGELESEMKKLIAQLDLNRQVQFFPHDSNVAELLMVSDYFIVPSKYEGLGIVFIESQAMELETFSSDRVPEEAQLGLMHRIELFDRPEDYAKEVIRFIEHPCILKMDLAMKEKYDINKNVNILKNIYKGDMKC